VKRYYVGKEALDLVDFEGFELNYYILEEEIDEKDIHFSKYGIEIEKKEKTRIEKIVDKIIPVIDMLRYIGNTKLDDEFKKYGVVLTKTSKLEDKYLGLNDENKCKTLVDIFTSATNIKQKVVDGNEFINSDIFTKKVPIDLQYDKGNNNTGIKPSDFKKLVDVKTKLILANSEEAKEKIEEKIEHIASEKQFEAARAELVRDKLMKLS